MSLYDKSEAGAVYEPGGEVPIPSLPELSTVINFTLSAFLIPNKLESFYPSLFVIELVKFESTTKTLASVTDATVNLSIKLVPPLGNPTESPTSRL